MDKRTRNRYNKIRSDQRRIEKRIKTYVTPLEKKLKALKEEEEKIMTQEVLAVCKEENIDVFEAIEKLKEEEAEEEKFYE